ncbi:MAG TPA: T9SS type A sorting domain-containing protein, partial [Candidatus Kapabacteria bacterium]
STIPFSDVIQSNDAEAPQLFPNPASHEIAIDASTLPGEIEASLISDIGLTVWQQSIPTDHSQILTFHLSAIPSGSYVLRLVNNEHSIERKCILER